MANPKDIFVSTFEQYLCTALNTASQEPILVPQHDVESKLPADGNILQCMEVKDQHIPIQSQARV